MQKQRTVLVLIISALMIFLTGCFKGEQSLKPVSTTNDGTAVEEKKEPKVIGKADGDKPETDKKEEDKKEKIIENVARQLYLIDANGLVVAQTIEIPGTDSKAVATQALEYLVKEGPITSLLPNGFQAVIPAGTEIIGLNLKEDGTMIVDVSDEFKNYDAKDEVKILQAITYTLTQFENVEKVKLWINGHPQDEMPVNGTPIQSGYSRANGINIIDSDAIDLINSKAVTMYYPKEHNNNRYFVPVTKHVENEDDRLFGSIIKSLIEGPSYETNLSHVFNDKTLLKSEPKLKDGVLEVIFSKEILKDADQAVISDEVIETLVRTLTEQAAVDAVDIKVENMKMLVNENGEAYDTPVTKKVLSPTKKL